MNDEQNSKSEQSGLVLGATATEIQTGNGSMIVGVSHRLAGMFTREEEECELPEDFKARNDDYDWLGVD
jgi:hypothetical protein